MWIDVIFLDRELHNTPVALMTGISPDGVARNRAFEGKRASRFAAAGTRGGGRPIDGGGEPSIQSHADVNNTAEATLFWKSQARDAGLGTSRKPDLHDLRTALLHKRLVYENQERLQSEAAVSNGYDGLRFRVLTP